MRNLTLIKSDEIHKDLLKMYTKIKSNFDYGQYIQEVFEKSGYSQDDKAEFLRLHFEYEMNFLHKDSYIL